MLHDMAATVKESGADLALGLTAMEIDVVLLTMRERKFLLIRLV